MNILYITYDGILEPLGESQVLSYQEKLSKDFNIYILSFEKKKDLKNTLSLGLMKNRIKSSSISWSYHTYHKSPSLIATFYDLLIGLIHSCFLIYKYKIKIVHARSYPPALIALILKKIFGISFIFDMRGFWADERVDGNIWKKNSLIYRLTKTLEKSFIQNSDHIISLTLAAVEEMKKFNYVNNLKLPITVISTCVDLDRFTPGNRVVSNHKLTFGYLGTVGTWYLFDETVRAFKIVLKLIPSAKIMIINKGEHEYIKTKLIYNKIPMSSVELIDAKYSEVPLLLKEISASIFFLKPLFSKKASAPTKLGELLACGIPCLTNDGVGDMGSIIRNGRVGVSLKEIDDKSIRDGLISLIDLTKQGDIINRCVSVANEHFSLEEGCKKYKKIYLKLLK